MPEKTTNWFGFLFCKAIQNADFARREEFHPKQKPLFAIICEGNSFHNLLGLLDLAIADSKVGGNRFASLLGERDFKPEFGFDHVAIS